MHFLCLIQVSRKAIEKCRQAISGKTVETWNENVQVMEQRMIKKDMIEKFLKYMQDNYPEPRHEKTCLRVCDRVRVKPVCSADQDQDQDSLLVKRRNDNHSPGPVIRELVPSSHQRSELSNTILCIFSG